MVEVLQKIFMYTFFVSRGSKSFHSQSCVATSTFGFERKVTTNKRSVAPTAINAARGEASRRKQMCNETPSHLIFSHIASKKWSVHFSNYERKIRRNDEDRILRCEPEKIERRLSDSRDSGSEKHSLDLLLMSGLLLFRETYALASYRQ